MATVRKPKSKATTPPASAPDRKSRAIARTRQDILEAAGRAFTRKGYHRATMEDVAHEAGFSVGSLYNYFAGKEELYRGLLEGLAEHFDASYHDPLLRSLPFEQRFETLMRKQLGIIEARRELFAWFLADRWHFDWEANTPTGRIAKACHQRMLEHVTALVSEGIAEGTFRPGDARAMAYFMSGAINAVVSRWLGGDAPGSLTDQVGILKDLLLHGLGQPQRRRR
ncbi:MAG: TetR/AcrR family transcriptional regulator [Deltaproteobacteria bacterium]|nr:TetR/AcrR family transcriptional regulator [Deltaproteobacteria bacterium]